MIRFGVVLTVVLAAMGLLVGGVLANSLLLVYVAIGAAALAAVMLTVGVMIWREEVFGPAPADRAGQGAKQAAEPVPVPGSSVAFAAAGLLSGWSARGTGDDVVTAAGGAAARDDLAVEPPPAGAAARASLTPLPDWSARTDGSEHLEHSGWPVRPEPIEPPGRPRRSDRPERPERQEPPKQPEPVPGPRHGDERAPGDAAATGAVSPRPVREPADRSRNEAGMQAWSFFSKLAQPSVAERPDAAEPPAGAEHPPDVVTAEPGEPAEPAAVAAPAADKRAAAGEPAVTGLEPEDAPPAGSTTHERSTRDPDTEVTVVPGITRYHRGGCILIRFLGPEDLETMSQRAAELASYVPCKACRPEQVLAGD